MTRHNDLLMPIYASMLAGIIGYLLNYTAAEAIYSMYAPSQLASPITLFQVALNYSDIYYFILLWVIVGVAAAYKTKSGIRGFMYPIVGFISAFILWSLLRSLYFATSFTTELIDQLPILTDGAVSAAIACGIGGIVGYGIGRYRWAKSQARMVRVSEPVIEFIPKCPKCGAETHSNAVFCALCGTEIYTGLGKDTIISEEQETVSTLI